MSKNKELNITFRNPNNDKDSQLIAEDFISRVAHNVVKDFVLNQSKNKDTNEESTDVRQSKDMVFGNLF
ncbi:MAG: hypothetical protein J6K16_00985 [Alphaproteobacteria bacterium]|nr:hypothetical protein [Alphaproteobacteria bacterium]